MLFAVLWLTKAGGHHGHEQCSGCAWPGAAWSSAHTSNTPSPIPAGSGWSLAEEDRVSQEQAWPEAKPRAPSSTSGSLWGSWGASSILSLPLQQQNPSGGGTFWAQSHLSLSYGILS